MEHRTRKLVKPADLNSRNTLFGGRLLEWIDEECYIFAACQLGTDSLVTKLMGEVDFKAPAHQGDVVEIGASVVEVGRSSITICCEARNKTTKQAICTINKIVFVCVGEDGHSKPHGVTPTHP